MKRNYDEWTKEELIKEVSKFKKQRKYGLVWEEEREPEEVVQECKENLPVLEELADKKIIYNKQGITNILIEGDNYHCLSVLNYTHKNKIDVIYIDPPYNTGAKNWKYNNNFVDANDTYRHSKWLNLMSKRLKLAKNLLRKDGVLICTIDENELYHLGCLLEEIFDGYEIHCITIVHNPRGVQGNNFSYINEYAYFVFRQNLKVIGPRKLKEEEVYHSNLRNWGGESLRSDARNCFYPILVKDMKIFGFGEVPKEEFHPKNQTEVKAGIYYIWPIDVNGTERKWRYARQSVEAIKDSLEIRNGQKDRIEIEIGKDYGIVKTVWQDPKYDAGIYGTQLIHNLVPNINFDFPKSVYAVFDCLFPILYKRKEAIILDFFAGSGTTGHAVMMLNKQDKGNRTFILCTNNENGIAKDVCYPRIKAVIEGNKNYQDITGISTNLRYFKTTFVGASPTDKNKRALVNKCTEMLCLKEDAFELLKKGDKFKIFRGSKTHLGIIFDEEGIPEFKKEAKNIDGIFNVYVFSLDQYAHNDEFTDMSNKIKLNPIPEVILSVYRRIFK